VDPVLGDAGADQDLRDAVLNSGIGQHRRFLRVVILAEAGLGTVSSISFTKNLPTELMSLSERVFKFWILMAFWGSI
jgi:hypothetical protein